MLILNLDEFLDFILRIIEEEIIISSMHQNYVFFDRDAIKSSIMIALDSEHSNNIVPLKGSELMMFIKELNEI